MNNLKYLVAMIIGVVLTLLLVRSCIPENDHFEGITTTKTDTIYKVVIDTIKFIDKQPNVVYKDKWKSIIQNDTVYVNLNSTKYTYTKSFNDSIHNVKANLRVNGSGTIDSIKVDFVNIDTTTFIYQKTTKEIIKYKPNKGVYINGQYNYPLSKDIRNKPFYSIGVDKQIFNDWIIIGATTTIEKDPVIGVKVGIKIK